MRRNKYNIRGILSSLFLDELYDALVVLHGEEEANRLLDQNSEHMLFYLNVTCFICESIFDPMYLTPKGPGKPAVNPRTLAAFWIYCQAYGLSPKHVLKQMKRNLEKRLAIGILSPSGLFSLKTFYNWKKRLSEYYERNGIDLFEKCFQCVTARQVEIYGVNATRLRMDSKMLDSNIKPMSRYEIVLCTLQRVLKEHPFNFSATLQKDVNTRLKENGEHTMYALKNGTASYNEILSELGVLVYEALKEIVYLETANLISSGECGTDYALLVRVFGEQFDIVNNTPVPKNGKDIAPDSVQNPYDEDATYLNKNGNVYRGYKTQATETFGNVKAPNLIVSYDLVRASVADCLLYEKSILDAERTTRQMTEVASADAGYSSEEIDKFNRAHFAGETTQDGKPKVLEQWTCKMGGVAPRYEVSECPESDDLKVVDKHTGKEYKGKRVNDLVKRDGHMTRVKRWEVEVVDDNGNSIVKKFTMEDVEKSNRRREIESLPPEKRFARNNVEATMFQLGYTTNGCQTKYRGLFSHRLFIGARVLWINFRRIVIFQEKRDKEEKMAKCA